MTLTKFIKLDGKVTNDSTQNSKKLKSKYLKLKSEGPFSNHSRLLGLLTYYTFTPFFFFNYLTPQTDVNWSS